MTAERQSVPFVNLNGCLREDFLFRVLHQALEALPASSAPGRAGIAKALAPIPIPGFRQFHRAPKGLQARAAMSQFRSSGEFVGQVLEVWLEAKQPLAEGVEKFLDQQGIPRDRIRIEAGEFRERWSLDEVFRLADLFRAEHGPADRDEIALLLCCLTSRAPVEAGPPAEQTPAADSSGTETASPPAPPTQAESQEAGSVEKAGPEPGAATARKKAGRGK
jgi:hypothetical protein